MKNVGWSLTTVLVASSAAMAQGSRAPGYGIELRAEKAVHKTDGGQVFRLHRAKVRGSDGKPYQIGQN